MCTYSLTHARSFAQQLGISAKEEVLGHEFIDVLKGEKTCKRTLGEVRDAVREERSCAVCLLSERKDKTPFWAQVIRSSVQNNLVTLQTPVLYVMLRVRGK